MRKKNRGPAAGPENRHALLIAAREVFAEDGLSAPLSAIAKRAGVGQGSLYRHFPDRTAIAAAVFEENITEIEEHLAPDNRTLDDLFDIVARQAIVSTALIDLIGRHREDPAVRALGIRFQEMVARIVDRERSLGHIAPDIEVADIALFTGMLASELARTDAAERDAAATRGRALIRRALAP